SPHEIGELGVEGRLSSTKIDDRRATIVHGPKTLFQGHAIFELAGVPLDRTADAGKVAGIEWLQHEHGRIPLLPEPLHPGPVLHLRHGETDWKSHGCFSAIQSTVECRRWRACVLAYSRLQTLDSWSVGSSSSA